MSADREKHIERHDDNDEDARDGEDDKRDGHKRRQLIRREINENDGNDEACAGYRVVDGDDYTRSTFRDDHAVLEREADEDEAIDIDRANRGYRKCDE